MYVSTVRSRLEEQLKLQIIFYWPNNVCFHIICHQPVLFMYDIYFILKVDVLNKQPEITMQGPSGTHSPPVSAPQTDLL